MPPQTAARPAERFLNANLKWRVITASVGIPVLLLAVYGGLPWVSAVALIAAGAASLELMRMAGGAGFRRYAIAFPALALTAAGVSVSGMGADSGAATAPAVFAGAAAALGIASAVTSHPRSGGKSYIVAWAAVYFGALLAHAPALAAHENGRDWLFIAILGTFAVDSAAYFTGRAVGRRKLAPKISPKKTWEGAVGGLIAGPVAVIGLNSLIGPGIPTWQAGAVGLAVAISGTLGDLAESALKRAVGVKDSGAVIPGHGGILDRIDSLAPGIATVYWLAVWSAM
ncbi:MAG: phosphatidate cytidylyltransferase [Dehalococcoidia bacterium]|nr:phosphatidate cytidylyltransferase [Dehalococcoidia bacterium]MSQ34286.1 phosphatidate cytidylyltransferase [Dehalococcoidia bacterium]